MYKYSLSFYNLIKQVSGYMSTFGKQVRAFVQGLLWDLNSP
jgi:hypothetical protein